MKMVKMTSSQKSAGVFTARRNAGGAAAAGDARSVLIAKKRRGMTDARDQLAAMARTTDARQKINKIRNLKQGKLDVKQTARGGITIVTTTRGQLRLTTNKKTDNSKAGKAGRAKAKAGRVVGNPALQAAVAQATASTRGAGSGGRVQKRAANNPAAQRSSGPLRLASSAARGEAAAVAQQRAATAPRAARPQQQQQRSRVGRSTNDAASKKLTRTITGHMSEAARLDEELINTHVDPVVLRRTIKQHTREREPSPSSRRYGMAVPASRERSRSPMDTYERHGRYQRRSYSDVDDPRVVTQKEDELYRRRMQRDNKYPSQSHRTIAERLDGGPGSSSGPASYVSPLQGVKIVVSNLQASVSQDDITELFGDVGALKRTKAVEPGTFEVVFVNKTDALKAVEIYHNRQLDGKAMKCQVVNAAAAGVRYK